jgi:saccharopine dehydrogenase (NAD+, L-lysine forming)
MSKVLIIGAGGVGNVVTRKCAAVPEVFTDIMLASRTLEKCNQIAHDVGGDRVRTAQVDADNVPELVDLINNFKPDLVINVALPYQDLTIMDACLETKTHYLDTANYEPKDVAKFEYSWQWAYHDRFKEAGHHGHFGLRLRPRRYRRVYSLCRQAYFDEIHTLDIVDCNAGDHGKSFATNFNPEINIREITQNGRYWENGQWVETKPLEIHKPIEYPEYRAPRVIPAVPRRAGIAGEKFPTLRVHVSG